MCNCGRKRNNQREQVIVFNDQFRGAASCARRDNVDNGRYITDDRFAVVVPRRNRGCGCN